MLFVILLSLVGDAFTIVTNGDGTRFEVIIINILIILIIKISNAR